MKSAPLTRGRWKQSAGRLDAAIRMAADDTGFIDLRLDNPGVDDPQARRLARRPSAEAGAHGARHGCRAAPMNDRA
jgi:hypothetical protein